MSVTCAPSPCGPALPVARLAGRYSCDYYGHSVAIGLASLRRSHVQQRYTSERDLGVPFASFNALTGHRSCAPEDYGMLLQFRRRDRRRLQASFRRGTSYPFWRLGFRQSSFRHITRIFPARRPVRLGTAAGFLACYCPLLPFGIRSAIRSRDISSHLCPLRGRYSTAPRGADRVGCAARSRSRCGCGPFPRSLPPNPAGIFQCTGLSSDCPAFASRRTSSTAPASCITHTSRFLDVRHLCPFALWSGSPGLQIGRALLLRLIRALCRHRTRVP
jgi:hypothetical protein